MKYTPEFEPFATMNSTCASTSPNSSFVNRFAVFPALPLTITPDGEETLLLEMRDRLLVWHTGGGRNIALLGRFPAEASDRLTPFSEPSFRGRSLGARPVWVTDIRIQDGKAWFRVGPDAPLTALEEWRRAHVGKRLGD